jgi:hypothetical protein
MIWSTFGSLGPESLQSRVVDIKAVDIVYDPAICLQEGGQREESQRLGPEVISGKIIHPGVNEEEIFP